MKKFWSRKNINDLLNNVSDVANQSSDFINSNFNKARKSVEQSVTKSYITGCSWMQINELTTNVVYTFRSNNQLLVTVNGNVTRKEFELLVDNNSVLISHNNLTEHFNLVNVKNDFLFLNKFSSEEVIVLANQTKFKDEMKSTLNIQAKQYKDYEIFELNQNNKFQKSEDADLAFISIHSSYRKQHPNSTIIDFISYLQTFNECKDIKRIEWEKYNKSATDYDFAVYLSGLRFGF